MLMAAKIAEKRVQEPPPPIPAKSPLRPQQGEASGDVPDAPNDETEADTEPDSEAEDEYDVFNMDEMRKMLDEIE